MAKVTQALSHVSGAAFWVLETAQGVLVIRASERVNIGETQYSVRAELRAAAASFEPPSGNFSERYGLAIDAVQTAVTTLERDRRVWTNCEAIAVELEGNVWRVARVGSARAIAVGTRVEELGKPHVQPLGDGALVTTRSVRPEVRWCVSSGETALQMADEHDEAKQARGPKDIVSTDASEISAVIILFGVDDARGPRATVTVSRL